MLLVLVTLVKITHPSYIIKEFRSKVSNIVVLELGDRVNIINVAIVIKMP